MAVLLVIAGNFSLRQIAKEKEEKSGGYQVDIPTNDVAPKQKRKQKKQTSQQSFGDENLNASLMEPIPMTKEELEDFKRKYTRDGRSKYAEYAER
jgi:regulatory protein YycI of two-component signal transduction system YycFG